MTNVFDITKFGAIGDGKTDCSEAIQKALDEAGKVKGTVIVPPGKYLCADLKVHRDTSIRGFDAWSFRQCNSSVLELSRPDAKCVLDITGAIGCTVSNLGIYGNQLGEKVHGVMLDQPIYDASGEEDTPTIENCRICNFSGSAVYFNHVWCVTIRNNMLGMSENGLYVDGWDLFISGNWFSGNRNCGLCGGETVSAMIFTNNRIEWNQKAGVSLKHGKFSNIVANQFDRAGGPQLMLYGSEDAYCRNVTVTGNCFNRSGSGEFYDWLQADGYMNSHIYAEDCVNLVITSNVFQTGRDGKDKEGKRHFGPDYSIVMKHLRASIIKDNTMQSGCIKQNIVDLGEHEEEVIVKDNVGGVMESEERWTAMLKNKPVEYIRTYYDLTDEEKKAYGIEVK